MDACGLSTTPLRTRLLATLAAAALAGLAFAAASSARGVALPNPCTILASAHAQSLTAKAAATVSPGKLKTYGSGKFEQLTCDETVGTISVYLSYYQNRAAPAASGSSASRTRRASAAPRRSPSGRAPGTTPPSTTSTSARGRSTPTSPRTGPSPRSSRPSGRRSTSSRPELAPPVRRLRAEARPSRRPVDFVRRACSDNSATYRTEVVSCRNRPRVCGGMRGRRSGYDLDARARRSRCNPDGGRLGERCLRPVRTTLDCLGNDLSQITPERRQTSQRSR